MKEWWNKLCGKLFVGFNDFLTNGGGYVVFLIAVIAIIFAIVGFWGTHDFDWKWFVFFHVPLYGFCGWALFEAMKMYKRTLNDIEKRQKEEQKDDTGEIQ